MGVNSKNKKSLLKYFTISIFSFLFLLDDLISLLDINSNQSEGVLLEPESGVFDEDAFRLTRRFGGRLNSNNNNMSISNSNSDVVDRDNRKNSYRIRDHRWYDSYREELFSSSSGHHHRSNNANTSSGDNTRSENPNNKNLESNNDSKNNEKSSTNNFSFVFGDNLQYWTEKTGETTQFIKIACLYSELVAISKDGRLHQWKWSSDSPFSTTINISNNVEIMCDPANSNITIYHPKTISLQILNERVCNISTSQIRASCWTESGKVSVFFFQLNHKN